MQRSKVTQLIRASAASGLLIAAALLAACNGDDIGALPEAINRPPATSSSDPAITCATPGTFTLRSGAAPTVNGDGSLSFGATGGIEMDATLSSTTFASSCLTAVLGGIGSRTEVWHFNDPSFSATMVEATLTASGQLDLRMYEDISGVYCPIAPFFSPDFFPGGTLSLYTEVDQTGAYPVMHTWILSDPATAPPDLASDDSGYCLTDSSLNWVNNPGNLMRLYGTDITVSGFEFGP